MATGLTLKDALGRRIEEVVPQFAPLVERLNQVIAMERPQMAEIKQIDSGKNVRYCDVMIFPLLNAGVLEGAVVRIDDVTEQRNIEEVMIQTEKMMTVGGLAAGMAHEINNPLGAIMQSVQNIERRLSADLPANREIADKAGLDMNSLQVYLEQRNIPTFFENIRTAGKTAAKIVSNMLQFSRGKGTTHIPVELTQMFDRALELASSDYDLKKCYDFKGISILRDYEAEMPLVPANPVEIEQVLLNILKNAAQSLGDNPPGRPPQIRVRVWHDDRWACVEVSDNGPGMEEHVKKRIFEPFFSTREVGAGIGIGLTVSYMIMTNNHKGSIGVESSPGNGARFTIRLPLEHK
jgi:signal transduction histidine kinase